MPPPNAENTLPNNGSVTVSSILNTHPAHKEDPLILKIIELKTNRNSKPQPAAAGKDGRVKIFLYHYDKYLVRNGLFYRSFRGALPHPEPVVVTSQKLEAEIRKGIHDSPFSGQLGVTFNG